MTTLTRPKLWVPGDWNAFFGFGTNILVNVLTLTGLLRYVLKMPDDLVFGRILPAVGLMLCLSTCYYAWLAYDLARKTGRNDVCALPSGPGVGHMFICVFVVMLPIKLQTGDPIKAWEAGLTWVFIQSIVLVIGGFLGRWVRKVTPRAALLGTLAGVSITFISMRPALQMFLTPAIGLVCFAILLVNWFGGVRYFRGLPAGLIAMAVGMAIAWGSNLFGLNYGGLSLEGLTQSFTHFGFSVPLPAFGHVFSGFEYLGVLLVTAIPFGIYDLVEAIDNVESAAAGGDSFPTTRVLAADGIVSMIGCLMGNPFILAVYIGHPGWKAMGGRIGYSVATGAMVIVLCWLGTVSVMLALVPVVSILPILLYIGMLMGSQAFSESPHRHAPAVVVALVPHLAAWSIGLIKGSLAAAGVTAISADLVTKMAGEGVLFHGLEILGGGAALGGLVLGAIAVYIIDRQLWWAARFAAAGAVLTFFGLMHGERIGLAQSPAVAASYLTMAVFLAGCAHFAAPVAITPTAPVHADERTPQLADVA
ncbi:regulator [Horticoccus sp. 23ND18S-11]|uniref:regulator n=1 Tax=Horticoccus sp. 23ND18S-11 TaxID=3391832 RepID=UPI0039C98B07